MRPFVDFPWRWHATWPTALVCLAVVCGCRPPGDPTMQAPGETRGPAVDASKAESAFRFDKTKNAVYLNTQVAAPQRGRFDIGQGSITLETLRVSDGKLTFRYTPEIEGGYTTYECTVPVSPAPVEFTITSYGTPGGTSFDLAQCKVISRGNLHLPPIDERIVRFVSWLKTKDVTLECTESTGDSGEWVLTQPKVSDDYDVVFRIRSFLPSESEAQMRQKISSVNLAYLLNAKAHLAMSYGGFRGKHPDAKPPPSDDQLPKLNGLPVTKAIQRWFQEYEADE